MVLVLFIPILTMKKKLNKHHFWKYLGAGLLVSTISVISVCSVISCSNNQTSNISENDSYFNLATTVYKENNTQLSDDSTKTNNAWTNWANYFNSEIKQAGFNKVINTDLTYWKQNINLILAKQNHIWVYGQNYLYSLNELTNSNFANNKLWAVNATYDVSDVKYQINNQTLNLSYRLTTTYNVAPVIINTINVKQAIYNVAQVTSLITVNNASIAPCLINYPYNLANDNGLTFNAYGGWYIKFNKELLFTNNHLINHFNKDNSAKWYQAFGQFFINDYLNSAQTLNSSLSGNENNYRLPASYTFSGDWMQTNYNFIDISKYLGVSDNKQLNQINKIMHWSKTVNLIPNLNIYNMQAQVDPMCFLSCYAHSRYYGQYSASNLQQTFNDAKQLQIFAYINN